MFIAMGSAVRREDLVESGSSAGIPVSSYVALQHRKDGWRSVTFAGAFNMIGGNCGWRRKDRSRFEDRGNPLASWSKAPHAHISGVLNYACFSVLQIRHLAVALRTITDYGAMRGGKDATKVRWQLTVVPAAWVNTAGRINELQHLRAFGARGSVSGRSLRPVPHDRCDGRIPAHNRTLGTGSRRSLLGRVPPIAAWRR